MARIRGGLGTALMVTMLGMLLLTAPSPARAEDDEWRVLLSTQAWLANIPKNGFVAANGFSNLFGIPVSVDTEPGQSLYPQWGAQVALQRGPWTLALAGQYVSFETLNTYTVTEATRIGGGLGTVLAGSSFHEQINAQRVDVDLALTYFYPDVVRNVLDINAGLGFKSIYTWADRSYAQPFPTSTTSVQLIPNYAVCKLDNCADLVRKGQVKDTDWIYGITIPMSLVGRLSSDSKWLLPFNVTPLLGAETRNDKDVVYQWASRNPVEAKRLDGTTFAYGVTSDLGVRYVFDNGVSLYGGFRVQYIEGHETYLAWGPIVGMSVRLGGK